MKPTKEEDAYFLRTFMMNKYLEALDFVKDIMLTYDDYNDSELSRECREKKKEALQLLEELVNNNLNIQDLDLIVLGAFRYALGRRTYIVTVVADFIKDNLFLFTNSDIRHFIREIERAAEVGNLGDECDKVIWENLLLTLRQELSNRGE